MPVADFLENLDENQKHDSERLIDIMRNISGEDPVMWGTSIIGFGSYHYTYASGREGDWMKLGFSPRSGKLSLYIACDAEELRADLDKIGKHKVGKGCIYINQLEDINIAQLKKVIEKAYKASELL